MDKVINIEEALKRIEELEKRMQNLGGIGVLQKS